MSARYRLENMSHGLCMFDAKQRVVIRQRPLCRDLRADARAGCAQHRLAPDHPASDRQWPVAGGNPEASSRRPESFNEASTAVHRLTTARHLRRPFSPLRGGGG